jgi:hypothetical protein
VSRQRDPAGVLPEPKGERRPEDIVSWVENAWTLVQRFSAKRETDVDAKARWKRAFDALTTAQDGDLAARSVGNGSAKLTVRAPCSTRVPSTAAAG